MKKSLKFSLSLLAVFAVALLSGYFAGGRVNAITVSDTQLSKFAHAHCDSKSDTKNRYGESPRSACIAGYKAGYRGDSKSSTCKKFLNIKSDCEDGYDAGKTLKTGSSAPLTNGPNGTGGTAGGTGGSGVNGSGGSSTFATDVNYGGPKNKQCGGGNDPSGKPYPVYEPSIDIGCLGKGNPIADATFAIIRFLTNGVGLVIIASFIWAGIQYASSRGDPQAVAMAKNRIQSNILALFIFIFAWSIINFVVPGAIFR